MNDTEPCVTSAWLNAANAVTAHLLAHGYVAGSPKAFDAKLAHARSIKR